MTPHHRTILCQLGQAVTTRPLCFVSPLGQRATLCHSTNGCRASKFTCLFFFLQPQHMSESHNLLMYVQTIRSLYEKGADWRSYDEAFRSLRQANNWGWESVCRYLWMNASESRPAATPSVTPFRSKGKASWGKAKWPSTKTCFALDRGRYVTQSLVVTRTSVDAVVAPTQRHGAIGNAPNPILLDRVQPPASLRPNRRLPVRDQPSSGDSMPTPVSPDALRYFLVGYNRNIVEYLLNGFQHGFRIGCFGLPAQQAKRVTNLKSAIEFPAVADNNIAKELALGRILGWCTILTPTNHSRAQC